MKYIPCGGCGAETPLDRCIGCLHPFTEEEKKEPFTASKYTEVVPGVMIGSITPEARDFLETIMDAWDKHYESLKEANGKDYEPSYYGFAYWLVRWSGLIQPAISQNEKPCQ